MTSNSKLVDRARDELFSHINRCGVIQAAEEDQGHWMDETVDYLAERYPDLTDVDLRDLHAVGMRFCQPAIARGAPPPTADVGAAATSEDVEATENTAAEDVDANAA